MTDIIKAKDGDFFISDWLRNRNTLEYLGAWESMFNPDFNYGEFAIIKSKAGLNNFKISISQMKQGIIYASEADLLNLALFGCTAKEQLAVLIARNADQNFAVFASEDPKRVE